MDPDTIDEPQAAGPSMLIPQPQRPTQFPLRVPVTADFGSTPLPAEVIGSTGTVLLLQAEPHANLPPLGTLVRLRLAWDRQQLQGRLAAQGTAGRFLFALGERAIRRSKRVAVDLPAVVRSAALPGPEQARVLDLSSGGARVEGLELGVGSELELSFTPPGRADAMTVQAFVVRTIDGTEVPTVGVAFRLA
jgi:hypothetical protein